MKKFVLVFLLCITSSIAMAADFNVTVTISDVKAQDVLDVVTEWRLRQLDENGLPKYASNGKLGEAILVEALRKIIDQQCRFDPNTCPTWAKTHLDNATSSGASYASEITDSVSESP